MACHVGDLTEIPSEGHSRGVSPECLRWSSTRGRAPATPAVSRSPVRQQCAWLEWDAVAGAGWHCPGSGATSVARGPRRVTVLPSCPCCQLLPGDGRAELRIFLPLCWG